MLDPKQRQRFLRDNRARIGIGIVVVMTLAAILAPLIARQNPIAIDLAHLLQRPSAQHWLGTDIQGRDIWSRLVYGAPDPRAGAVGSLWDVLRDRRLDQQTEVIAGVLEDECARLLREFFAGRRSQGG